MAAIVQTSTPRQEFRLAHALQLEIARAHRDVGHARQTHDGNALHVAQEVLARLERVVYLSERVSEATR